MKTIRLTAAQAMVRFLSAQKNSVGDPLIAGCWAIFGHGNVAGLGEALEAAGDDLPTWRGHNEQSMAHAAIAFAKAKNRQQMMAVTTSIGPGALNMVTAAALAHVNRLPVLLIPGDVFANRAPDPVLQQVEDFEDGTVSANDCFRPVSRYFDRITRPEQLLAALPRAMACLTDPAACGPVTLSFCQDVQAEAHDWPASFFEPRVWHQRRIRPDRDELEAMAAAIGAAKRPLLIAGGGVLYSGAGETLARFCTRHQIPMAETQAGKSAVAWDHSLNFGSIGVTGTSAANGVAEVADLIIGVGTRFADFTTGSWALFKNPDRRMASINVTAFDAGKHDALCMVADAKAGLEELGALLGDHTCPAPDGALKTKWLAEADAVMAPPTGNTHPTDAQVIGAVQRTVDADTIVVCAAGGLPGEFTNYGKRAGPTAITWNMVFRAWGMKLPGGWVSRWPGRIVMLWSWLAMAPT